MISLGVVDLVLILLLVFAVILAGKRQATGFTIVFIAILVTILVERVAPGTLANVGTAIQGVNRVNDTGPHIQIQPVIHFEK